MQKFQYKARKSEDWEKREKQSAGNFVGFIIDSLETYTVRKGENWIRILPPTWEEAQHYGLDIWVHYGVGPQNASMLCLLKMKNQACPVCEARQRAEDEGKEELASELKPTRRVLAWIIDRKEEKKPQLWPMAWTVDRDISKVARDRQTGELYQLDHPESGYDVSFDVEGEAATRKYTGIQLARRASSVKDEHLAFIMEHPLPECLIWRSYAEMSELLMVSGAPSQPGGKQAASTAGAPTMPEGLSPRQQDEWERQHAQGPTSAQGAAVSQQVEQKSATTVSHSEQETKEEPVQRRAVVQDPTPAASSQGSSGGAPVVENKPAVVEAAPAATPAASSRAAALRARFGK